MDAPYVKARLDLVRHRRVVGVVATVDLAALLLLIALDGHAYVSVVAWFEAQVAGFTYLGSLFDVLALAVVRWLLLVGYSANVPVLRLFFLPFFVCLCSVPYLGIKALFVGLDDAAWQPLTALATGLVFAAAESVLLAVGIRLHLRSAGAPHDRPPHTLSTHRHKHTEREQVSE
jgi:hypothetical protein